MRVRSSNPPWNLLDLKSKGPPAFLPHSLESLAAPLISGTASSLSKLSEQAGGVVGHSGLLHFEMLFASGELDRLQPLLRWELGEAGLLLVPSGSR